MTNGDKKRNEGNFFIRLLATFFFSGYLPKAPGSWASAFTAIILFFIWPRLWYYQLLIILLLYIIGVWISNKAEAIYGHDSNVIVIDEVVGQMAALFMVPVSIIPFILSFLMFRLFDVVKPPPAKAWESLRGGWGVMSDDIAAAFYAAVILHLFLAVLTTFGITYI